MPQKGSAEIVGKQLLRPVPSVKANYRAGCRSRSPQEFHAKLGLVEEETDESMFWIALLAESELVRKALVENLLKEADEILAVVVASIKKLPGTGFVQKTKSQDNKTPAPNSINL